MSPSVAMVERLLTVVNAKNVVSTRLGEKFKLARITYVPCDNEEVAAQLKEEAFEHAVFISYCFDNYEAIIQNDLPPKIAEQ